MNGWTSSEANTLELQQECKHYSVSLKNNTQITFAKSWQDYERSWSKDCSVLLGCRLGHGKLFAGRDDSVATQAKNLAQALGLATSK